MPDLLRRLIMTTSMHCIPRVLLDSAQWGPACKPTVSSGSAPGDTQLAPPEAPRTPERGNREPTVSTSSPSRVADQEEDESNRCNIPNDPMTSTSSPSHVTGQEEDESDRCHIPNDENVTPHRLDYNASGGKSGGHASGIDGSQFPLSPAPCPQSFVQSPVPPHLDTSMPGAALLPPALPSKRGKLCVVLDIDETLVCAYNSAAIPAHLRVPPMAHRHRTFNLQCNGSDTLTIYTDEPTGPGIAGVGIAITVFERPGLAVFLRELERIAEVVVFTAGMEGYAKPLIDAIDPTGTIGARLYRGACVSTPHRDHVKDLSRLGRDLRRTVLVDNNPFSFLLQPHNGVPALSFSGDPDDFQLEHNLLPLLRKLAAVAESGMDVRPLLARRFRMLEWFQTHGIDLTGEAAGWALRGDQVCEFRV